jgi:hypothetical protein
MKWALIVFGTGWTLAYISVRAAQVFAAVAIVLSVAWGVRQFRCWRRENETP